MAVGKGSILRASNAAKKTEAAKTEVVKMEEKVVETESVNMPVDTTEITLKVQSEKKATPRTKKEKNETNATRMVPIELLVMPPADWKQLVLSKEEKDELKASIENYGVLQPLLIWKKKSGRKEVLIVIDGLKRKYIAEELKIEQLPVVTVEVEDEEKARDICLEIERLAVLKNQKRKYRIVEGIPSQMPAHLL